MEALGALSLSSPLGRDPSLTARQSLSSNSALSGTASLPGPAKLSSSSSAKPRPCRAILFEPPPQVSVAERESPPAFPSSPPGRPQPQHTRSQPAGSGLGVLYDSPQRGTSAPFGAVARAGGVNFAVQSSAATSMTLCLFTPADLVRGSPSAEVPLDPVLNRTGNVWHVFLPSISQGLLYGYRAGGPMSPDTGLRFDASKVVLDPYAKAVVSRGKYGELGPGENTWPQMAGAVPHHSDSEYDWEGDARPNLRMQDLIIYEAHVRGFTRHASSRTRSTPGTYRALIEKIPHLKEMGFNAVELMPVHEFNELEYYAYNPVTSTYKYNFWGYSTINFFSPMSRYSEAGAGDCGKGAVREFKDLVKACHRAGVEVILDVVFNHTAEGNEMGPSLSFRGLDNRVFYMTAPKGEFYNYSGCGNTFNCNHPVVRRFIVDCLRYWVLEFHVDGFRFDLASILTRASSMWDKSSVFGPEVQLEGDTVTTGTPLAEPPLIDMISNDPVLSSVKLIAEAWDAGGLYQVGSFPHWGTWAEWNGQYRDVVRQFIKGTDGMVGSFANMLCGSPHLYQEGGRKPYHSVNFVTAHDGFTLYDLVAFNEKHNEANGESNNDGENHNLSWNCGEEGLSVEERVEVLRQRQMRNFFVALMTSQGVPMVLMGDEYGHTKGGNNNTYCHDSELNYMLWDRVEADESGLVRFCKNLLKLRSQSSAFRLSDFPNGDVLQWHGIVPCQPDWSETSRFIAFTVRDPEGGAFYVAFNTGHTPALASLPEWGVPWDLIVDTSKPPPFDFLTLDTPEGEAAAAQVQPFLYNNVYPLLPYSSIILKLSS